MTPTDVTAPTGLSDPGELAPDIHPIAVGPLIDPAVFEAEREKIFRRAWLYFGRADEIPKPGDFKVRRVDVCRTAVIAVRGKDGLIRAFHNLCTHRGNKVVPGLEFEQYGRARGNALTCRFHGWVFDSTGALAHVPDEDEFPGLDKSCLGLKPVCIDTWNGFMFINLSTRPEKTLTQFLAGLNDHYDGYDYSKASLSYKYSATINCNWKVAIHAFIESYHVPTIHQATFPTFAKIDHSRFRAFGPHSASAVYIRSDKRFEPTPATGIASRRLSASPAHRPHPEELPAGINPEKDPGFLFELPQIFPTFGLHLGAGCGYPGLGFFTHEFWPLAQDKTLWLGVNYFVPPTRPSEEIAIRHVNALHRNAWYEDTATMEDTHDALASGMLDVCQLQTAEAMIGHFDAAWHKAMA